jgi:hypothetical protein
MICYKDMTFCKSDCINTNCFRNWTEEKSKDAKKWWGSDNAPVAFSDFSKDCKDYKCSYP